MKDQIIAEIRRLTELRGTPPGYKAFVTETGITEGAWRGKYWARWGDALTEAGYAANEWTGRSDLDALLGGLAKACRHFGYYPTKSELTLLRNQDPTMPNPAALFRNYGGRAQVIAALRAYASERPDLADVCQMLPDEPQPQPQAPTLPSTSAKAKEGHVYLIKSGDFYKVGRSDDLERRVKEIRIALPDKAELVHAIRTDDPPGIEAYWHKRFADSRANGEWFKLSPAEVAAFRKRKFQ